MRRRPSRRQPLAYCFCQRIGFVPPCCWRRTVVLRLLLLRARRQPWRQTPTAAASALRIAITESHRPRPSVFGWLVCDERRALASLGRMSLRNVAAARCSCPCTAIVVGSDSVGTCRRHRHCRVPSLLDLRQWPPAVPLDSPRRLMPYNIPKRHASSASPRRRRHVFEQAAVVDPTVAGI